MNLSLSYFLRKINFDVEGTTVILFNFGSLLNCGLYDGIEKDEKVFLGEINFVICANSKIFGR